MQQPREILLAIDPNVRARAYAYYRAYNAAHRGQGHNGPLTRACRDVLRALLWLTARRSSISYDAIAAEAGCSRSTVWRSIVRMRAAGLLQWVNRYVWSDRHRKVVRTTNHFSWLHPAMPKFQNAPINLTSVVPAGASQVIGARSAPRSDAGDELAGAIGRFLALKPT